MNPTISHPRRATTPIPRIYNICFHLINYFRQNNDSAIITVDWKEWVATQFFPRVIRVSSRSKTVEGTLPNGPGTDGILRCAILCFISFCKKGGVCSWSMRHSVFQLECFEYFHMRVNHKVWCENCVWEKYIEKWTE